LAGIVVQVSGMSVVTDDAGVFRFPAVPEGEHHLTLRPGSIAPTQLTMPEVPYRFTVEAQQVVDVAITVVQSARVEGRVVFVRPSDGASAPGSPANVVLGSGKPEEGARLVAGLTVELRSGDTVLRTLTDTRGGFSFSHLLPGDWELTFVGQLPETYRLENAAQRVVLKAGAVESVQVDLVPVARRIQFQDGGTLNVVPKSP
jgi:hypothetical protein